MTEKNAKREDLTRLRGFRDLIGPEAELFTFVEERARAIAERYAIREIRIPLMERIGLYERSTGDTSDIVAKQMYLVQRHEEGSASGDMVLRPEGTPGTVRAYIEAGLDRSDPEQRFYYSGPVFRYERPQKGRYRQFYQFGVEVFGRADSACDAELLVMIDDLRRDLALEFDFELNSIGCGECRARYREALVEYYRPKIDQLCKDCHERLERNPLRLLDCKNDVAIAEAAPKSIDYLCDACRKHFDTVLDLLARAGVTAKVNHRIVRGLDYYTRTTFEVTSRNLGSQNTVVAGGRYDGLVETLGGASVPGVGFAIGVDRVVLLLQSSGREFAAAPPVAIVALGEVATQKGTVLARQLRSQMRVELVSPERSLRAALKRADRLGSRYALIIGENELARGVVQVRDLQHSDQREIAEGELAQFLMSNSTQR
jgi:histidyl-tRNA synthetase